MPRTLVRHPATQPATLLLALLLSPVYVSAAPVPEPEPASLQTVVVIGSRAPEPLQQVVGSVSAIEREDLDRFGVIDLIDLERLVPGLAVPTDAARFGHLGFNLRGMEGNRVSIEVDGVPLPDSFNVGQFAYAARDLVEMAAVQRVEVLRGPASTLYGSKALGGVVAYTTRRPEDYLWNRDTWGAGLRLGVSSRDDSVFAGGHYAAQNGPWSGFVALARRQGHEMDNHPPAGGMRANPADYQRDAVLAKLEYDGGTAGRWTFTADHGAGRTETDVQSLVRAPGRYATTTALDADDRWQRDRVSLAGSWQQAADWLDALDLLLYVQSASTSQRTEQFRDPDAATRWPTLRSRRFDLDQDSSGLRLVAQSRGEWLGLQHWHVYGVDLTRHRFDSVRTGAEINLDTGASSNVVLGERFPVRDFPKSTSREIGLFWQDEMRLGERWALVPGLRWEHYRLDAHPDAIWREDNPHLVPADVTSSRWTPKLGLRFDPSPNDTLYLQAVRGYRAPPFQDVNIGLYLAALNYTVRPNPDLRPETSLGLEAGWRHQGEDWQLSLALYENRFRDLIESRASLGIDPATGALVFQSVNRDRARIRGAELEARWAPAAFAGWFGEVRASASRGTDTARDQPLNTVQPDRASLAAGYDSAAGFGGQLVLTGVRAMDRVDESAGPLFKPGGYARWDANLWWRIATPARLDVTLGNLGNRRYAEWASLRGVAPTAPDIGLYYQPGRWASLSLSLDW